MSDYQIRNLPAQGEISEAARRWEYIMSWSFGGPTSPEESIQRWWRAVCADRSRIRGAWPDAPMPGNADDTPVATFQSFDQTINTGHGHLEPANLITNVTVRTSARRQGLLSQLMRADLTEAHERGIALAALTASEATIYGRFGFGIATQACSWTIDTNHRFRLREPIDHQVVEIDLDKARDPMHQAFDAFHARSTGSHGRPTLQDEVAIGVWSYDGKPLNNVRAAAHFAADGTADGVVTFSYQEKADHLFEIQVREFIAANSDVELRLWAYLASIDMAETVKCGNVDPNSVLRWALVDPRIIHQDSVRDLTWLRILDVARALQVRGWDSSGSLTLEIDDAMGFTPGLFQIQTDTHTTDVTQVHDAQADLSMDISVLSNLYFGLVDVKTLARAGLVEGSDSAIEQADALFATAQQPYNIMYF